jgi:exodeoxyribonuclease I
VPLAVHPTRSGEIIVYDLAQDPADLLTLDADAIADRMFTARADLPEGVERIPLRTVHANRSPALAPLSVLKGADMQRLQLDLDRCLVHADTLRAATGLGEKLRRIFQQATDLPPPEDPELALYSGFLPDSDKRLLREVRATPPEQLAQRTFAFRDARYAELLFRYRARNWPETLSPEERERWETFRIERLTRPTPLTLLTLADYFDQLTALRNDPSRSDKLPVLDQLQAWGEQLATEAGVAA